MPFACRAGRQRAELCPCRVIIYTYRHGAGSLIYCNLQGPETGESLRLLQGCDPLGANAGAIVPWPPHHPCQETAWHFCRVTQKRANAGVGGTPDAVGGCTVHDSRAKGPGLRSGTMRAPRYRLPVRPRQKRSAADRWPGKPLQPSQETRQLVRGDPPPRPSPQSHMRSAVATASGEFPTVAVRASMRLPMKVMRYTGRGSDLGLITNPATFGLFTMRSTATQTKLRLTAEISMSSRYTSVVTRRPLTTKQTPPQPAGQKPEGREMDLWRAPAICGIDVYRVQQQPALGSIFVT